MHDLVPGALVETRLDPSGPARYEHRFLKSHRQQYTIGIVISIIPSLSGSGTILKILRVPLDGGFLYIKDVTYRALWRKIGP